MKKNKKNIHQQQDIEKITLKKENELLKKQIEQMRVKLVALEALIEVTEQELNIDLKKKSTFSNTQSKRKSP